MASIRGVIGLLLVLLMLGAVCGCEKTYGTSDAEMVRQMYDLTDEILSLDCLPPRFRSSFEKSKNFEHHDPNLTRESVQAMQAFLNAYKTIRSSGATCEQLQSM